jgi:GLPGLI family protein
MTTLTKFLVVLVIMITANISAQDFQGVATYKSKRQVDVKLDSTKMDSEMQKRVMEMMKKQFEKTYKLTFNKEESIYKEEEKLDKPQAASGNMVMVMVNTGGSDVLYKNTQEERFSNKNDVFGKIFLIQDQLKKQDWQLGSETKNIGEYTCYKATMKREIEVSSNMSENGETKAEAKPEKKEITITAWYTPQIPINNGPESYWGLPGLILEINDESQTIICSKIVMNPKDKMEIREPGKGKKVTQKEYDKILEKKMKEMNERFQRSDGHGDDINIQIKG